MPAMCLPPPRRIQRNPRLHKFWVKLFSCGGRDNDTTSPELYSGLITNEKKNNL